MQDDDAKFLIKEFVMPAVERIDRKLETICTAQLETRLTQEQMKAKIAMVEMMVIGVQEALEKHKQDMQQHYNPYYNETVLQKVWRKKPEIAAGGGLGALIVAILTWLMNNIQ